MGILEGTGEVMTKQNRRKSKKNKRPNYKRGLRKSARGQMQEGGQKATTRTFPNDRRGGGSSPQRPIKAAGWKKAIG